MPSRQSRRLVIDTSVAKAAGETEHPTSKHCRDFLQAVREICHKIVMTPAIKAEWNRHQSSFARKWRTSMMGRRKVGFVDVTANDELRNKIACAASSDGDREAIKKDIHLIEAAMATDRIVVSLDETARVLFAAVAPSVGELRNVVWINPAQIAQQPIPWLENGAKAERERLLGFQ